MKKAAALFLAFLFCNTTAQAALVTFDALDTDAGLGDIFTVDIVGQGFPVSGNGIQSGGVNLFFDQAVVNVLSVAIDSGVWNYAAGTGTGIIDNGSGQVTDITVTAFPGVVTGDFLVATVQFQAIAIGSSALTLTDSTLANPWSNDGVTINPGYAGDGTNPFGTVSVVPIPAALWLFGSALLSVAGLARRRRV